MSRIGVISNVRSRRNRRALPSVRAVLGRHPGVLHRELNEIEELPEILTAFADRDIDLLVVNGGDGTVQAVMTALLNERPFRAMPRLALLHGGMTNLAAHRLGLRGKPDEALQRLISRAGAGARLRSVRQPVLSVRRTPDERPVHGLFLGTAAFYHASVMSRERIHRLGVERSLQAGMSVAYSLWQALFARSKGEWAKGHPMTIEADGAVEAARPRFLFLATTLDRLMLGLRPFWGEGEGAIHWTVVEHPPRRLLLALWPVMRGRPQRWMNEAGYRSHRAHRVTLGLDCPIMFDGEPITPEPGCQVALWHEHELEFLPD
ncbi:MAG: diacylglycerol kinase family protein [Dongiaceae bacterium]